MTKKYPLEEELDLIFSEAVCLGHLAARNQKKDHSTDASQLFERLKLIVSKEAKENYEAGYDEGYSMGLMEGLKEGKRVVRGRKTSAYVKQTLKDVIAKTDNT